MNHPSSVVIVGAGAAGGQASLALRRLGYEGALELIGAEPLAPYERPPLSKEVLTRDHTGPTWIIEPAMLEQLDIRTRLGIAGRQLDMPRGRLLLADGEEVLFEHLLIATGAAPRVLSIPGADLDGVRYLRTFEDAQSASDAIQRQEPVVIIGGGFIGLEVAAAACAARCPVTVVEAGRQIMGRVVPSQVADIFSAEHRRCGVRIEMGRRPVRLLGTRSVEAVELDDGTIIPAATVIVGIGVIPEMNLGAQAGVGIDDGIVVDAECRTSLPRVYAAGDCCRMTTMQGQRGIRVEAWQSALDQGDRAAHAMLGISQLPPSSAWFWSNQYDYQLQVVGAPLHVDQVVYRGVFGKPELLCFQLCRGRLVGAIAVNRARDMAWVRRALPSQPAVDPDNLADERWALRQLVAQPVAEGMS